MPKPVFFPPIGISGNALSGKDTLCEFLSYMFNYEYDITAKRCSIAGDVIKKDLKELLFSKIFADVDFNDPKQKESLRPLMVEYGRLILVIQQIQYIVMDYLK